MRLILRAAIDVDKNSNSSYHLDYKYFIAPSMIFIFSNTHQLVSSFIWVEIKSNLKHGKYNSKGKLHFKIPYLAIAAVERLFVWLHLGVHPHDDLDQCPSHKNWLFYLSSSISFFMVWPSEANWPYSMNLAAFLLHSYALNIKANR